MSPTKVKRAVDQDEAAERRLVLDAFGTLGTVLALSYYITARFEEIVFDRFLALCQHGASRFDAGIVAVGRPESEAG